jgi:hypothetical protein
VLSTGPMGPFFLAQALSAGTASRYQVWVRQTDNRGTCGAGPRAIPPLQAT